MAPAKLIDLVGTKRTLLNLADVADRLNDCQYFPKLNYFELVGKHGTARKDTRNKWDVFPVFLLSLHLPDRSGRTKLFRKLFR